ncbi:MAG TPA: hypothetical protein VK814_11740 [Acidobacteriaceae bacterium]|jgi:hypothetical protein|nr:hypothetical protein [Acidobacteriaceae bacterium]
MPSEIGPVVPKCTPPGTPALLLQIICLLLLVFGHSLSAHSQGPAPITSLPTLPDLPNAPSPQITPIAESTHAPPLSWTNDTTDSTYEPPQVPNQSGPPRWWKSSTFDPDAKPDPGYLEHYQWRGLIWQSVEFNIVENGFRISSDSVMRDTLAHRPFWHDWLASTKQFNMRRWNDGDDFIVNYVGHPMQGAVATYIEIQNSPTDRRLQWGDPGYGKSRFKGFLWSVVYSTHSEISPAGEAGIGNEGGFTYPQNCLYQSFDWPTGICNPGKKSTNNTGWVDFIITPTVGMVWVTAEDVIDRYVTRPMVLRHPDRFWPLVVRSGLSPSRSFANMLRWKVPWYRDYEQAIQPPNRVFWFPSKEVAEYRTIPQVQLAPFWDSFSIAANTPTCFNCRETSIGGGLQTTLKIRGWLGFDTSVSYHPNTSPLPSDRAGGNMLAAFFGLSASRQWHYYALHFALRPGMVQFDQAYLRSPVLYTVLGSPPRVGTIGGNADGLPYPGVTDANGTPQEPPLGAIHHFAWDWQLAADYRLTQRIAFRIGLEEAVVRYRTAKVDEPGIGSPPIQSWLSKQQFINRGNFVLQLGPVFNF